MHSRSSPFLSAISPLASVVTKPSAHISFLGYSNKTTPLKFLFDCVATVSNICLRAPYIFLMTGTLSRRLSPN